MKLKRGFTILELIIVIAVVGILSIIAFATLGGGEDARDKRRISEIKSVEKALQLYNLEHGSYPLSSEGSGKWSGHCSNDLEEGSESASSSASVAEEKISYNLTTNITSYWRTYSDISTINDGITENEFDIVPSSTYGKNITFSFSKKFNMTNFKFFNRTSNDWKHRIENSYLSFFSDNEKVGEDLIITENSFIIQKNLSAYENINKVILTFSSDGDGYQNFREIEFYGKKPDEISSSEPSDFRENYISGDFSPKYIPENPIDPKFKNIYNKCYVYKSNGQDYMFMAFNTMENLEGGNPSNTENPEYIQELKRPRTPTEPTIAVYSEGAKDW